MLDNEIWKVIKYSKQRKYEVSNIGRRRVTTLKSNQITKLDFGTLKRSIGYYNFGGLGLAHRVIAIAFIPNLENKPCVNHIDGDKTNNHISNLEWCTYQENTLHSWNIGLSSMTDEHKRKIKKGSQKRIHSDEVKQKISEARKNKTIYTFIHKSGLIEVCSKYDLYTKYNLSPSNLSGVCQGIRKQCNGWKLKQC